MTSVINITRRWHLTSRKHDVNVFMTPVWYFIEKFTHKQKVHDSYPDIFFLMTPLGEAFHSKVNMRITYEMV